jgi:diguanylate cyclase (GGDEF)-like protein
MNPSQTQTLSAAPHLALLGDMDALPTGLAATLGRHYQAQALDPQGWAAFWADKAPPCVALFGLSRASAEALPGIVAAVSATPQVALVVCVGDSQDGALWRALGQQRVPNAFPREAALAQIEHAISGAELTRWLRDQSRLRDARLEHLHQTLRSFHMVDMDTGLYNRRYLLANLHERLALARRYERALSLVSCVVINHDELKGRLHGDALSERCEALADAIQIAQRTSDLVARSGEDVFVVVLPDTDAAGAEIVARRLHRILSEHLDEDGAGLSLRVGCATSQEGDLEPLQLLDRSEAHAREDFLELGSVSAAP